MEGRRRYLTQREKFKIKRLLEDGMSYRQIAIKIDRPRSTVYSYITRPPDNYGKIPIEIPESVIDMYTKDKMSIRQIMAATGGSYGGVHDKLKRNGVILRGRGGYHR